jgi:hypothetical protein
MLRSARRSSAPQRWKCTPGAIRETAGRTSGGPLWLGVLARDLYRSNLGHRLDPAVNSPAAIVFCMHCIAGILSYAVVPALAPGSLGHAILSALRVGLFTHMTHELTSMATLPMWPLKVGAGGRARGHGPLGNGRGGFGLDTGSLTPLLRISPRRA